MKKTPGFKEIRFKDDDISFLPILWDELDQLVFKLSKEIKSEKIDVGIDRIVTLAKGGWPMTYSLVNYLSINKVASIGVKFYTGIGKHLKHPKIYQNIPVSIYNEKVLLFDDVSDTGSSLRYVKDHLLNIGAKKVYTATIFYKPHSTFKPDFYGLETSSWIIFPYDGPAMIKMLKEKWEKNDLPKNKIIERLQKLKIKKDVIDFYYNYSD